jgi:hypothetical protein
MIKKVWLTVHGHRELVILTLELFWIAIFLLDRAGKGGAGGVPQFVYVNF